MNGAELQNHAFFATIAEGGEQPYVSVARCLPAVETPDRFEKSMA